MNTLRPLHIPDGTTDIGDLLSAVRDLRAIFIGRHVFEKRHYDIVEYAVKPLVIGTFPWDMRGMTMTPSNADSMLEETEKALASKYL